MKHNLNLDKFRQELLTLRAKNVSKVNLTGRVRTAEIDGYSYRLALIYSKDGNPMSGHKVFHGKIEALDFLRDSKPTEGHIRVIAECFNPAGELVSSRVIVLGTISIKELLRDASAK